jgi:signal transduction histidine kinase/CheY-like chemotaxis protein
MTQQRSCNLRHTISSNAADPAQPLSDSRLDRPPACSTDGRSQCDGVIAPASRLTPAIRRRSRPAIADETVSRPERNSAAEWKHDAGSCGMTGAGTGTGTGTGTRDFSIANDATPSPRSKAPNDWPNDEPVTQNYCSRANCQGKRPHEDETPDVAASRSSPLKKPRTHITAAALAEVDQLASTPRGSYASPGSRKERSASPLFLPYSSTFRQMSTRPGTANAPEPAAAMLALLQEDTDNVTTVKLPRGTVSAGSPAHSGSTPGNWLPSDAAAVSRNPDSRPNTPGMQLLQGIGVVELLDQDERPTFIVDLANPGNSTHSGLHLLYSNSALRLSKRIMELLVVDSSGTVANTDFVQFKAWVMSFVANQEATGLYVPPFLYGDITWTCSTLRRRFRCISGNVSASSITPTAATSSGIKYEPVISSHNPGSSLSLPHQAHSRTRSHGTDVDYFGNVDDLPAHESFSLQGVESAVDSVIDRHHPDAFTEQVLRAQPLDMASYDWTRIPLTPDLPEHILFARTVDWASTPLGPIELWDTDLRAVSNLVMASPNPAALYWGPEYIAIYNAAYVDLAGQKHPRLMGMRYADAWSEIWDELEPMFRECWESGKSIMKEDNQLFMYRKGFLEETFFSWSIVPVVGQAGSVVGLYNPAFDNTTRKVNERRMLTLREVGERTALARDVKHFWPQLKKGLEYNEFDVPFALVYSVKDDNTESEVSSMHSGSLAHPPQIVLEATVGVPDDHHAAVHTLDLRTSDEGFARYMRESLTTGDHVILDSGTGTLPSELIEGLEWRGFGDWCNTVVVFPVHPTPGGESVIGFMVLGINPRSAYDGNYQLFIHLLSRQLATSMASVVLFEEEIKRNQKAARLAALDRQELSMQLYLRTQEAVESEYKFTRMTEFAPVGMFIANSLGMINYCNDMWWQISRHPRSEDNLNTWMQSVRDEDREGVEREWAKLINQKVAITHEFRFQHSRQSEQHSADTWVLLSAYPEKDERGGLKSIFGCITDISRQKLAEDFQKQRRDEAVELKRQQENFIDITSHEMRNPLSAVLQCADEITNSIAEFRAKQQPTTAIAKLLDGCTDAANTINLCASHQKRIVDDILTLSKLDSQLLLVTPVDVRPVAVVESVLKMFEVELNTNNISLDFHIEQSYLDCGVDWVKLDPSRLTQVLINLVTNAIKFTQNCEKRFITVSLGASWDISEATKAGQMYFPTLRDDLRHMTEDKDWGTGEEINIHFSVKDTGLGLMEQETKLLFERFSQETPRTHVQYGGSGLGLFISKILTELQGGEIGVQTQKGVGSKFSFYVKSRKSENMSSEALQTPGLAQQRSTRVSEKLPSSLSASPVHMREPTPSSQQSFSRRPSSGALPLDVLIVEDNLVNQKVLQKQLKNCGNNAFVANHGGEALDTIRKSRFWSGQESDGVDISIILMDLEMPVMDGMTCARRIRELERNGVIVAHIPIIAVTAYARPEQIRNALDAGIVSPLNDIPLKPFDYWLC